MMMTMKLRTKSQRDFAQSLVSSDSNHSLKALPEFGSERMADADDVSDGDSGSQLPLSLPPPKPQNSQSSSKKKGIALTVY